MNEPLLSASLDALNEGYLESGIVIVENISGCYGF
jgi:hypothetical protein